MRTRPIGYYVHHQGAGHLTRARAIANASSRPIILLGTGLGAEDVDLPDDRPTTGEFDGADDAACRPDALHYAPLDHPGIRCRVAKISTWIATEKPALMIVDVSVEVAMLARLASVPTVYVRLNGDRRDLAHLDAFRSARAIMAPYHRDLEAASTPQWVRNKTRYCPGLIAHPDALPGQVDGCLLLIVKGRGGPPADGEAMAQAALACPEWRWRVIGPCTLPRQCPDNLDLVGWVADPDREIGRAALIVGAAGDGLVSSILAADRPFICIPEPRAYGEQVATARRLGELGAAVMLEGWPRPGSWPGLIRTAMHLTPEPRRRLHDRLGTQKVAFFINELASAGSREGGPIS